METQNAVISLLMGMISNEQKRLKTIASVSKEIEGNPHLSWHIAVQLNDSERRIEDLALKLAEAGVPAKEIQKITSELDG